MTQTKRFLSLILITVMFVSNLQMVFANESDSEEIIVNMDVNFENESFVVGKVPPYNTTTHFSNDNGQGMIQVAQSDGNKYLYLQGKKTTSTENPVIVVGDILNSETGSFKAKFKTNETFGRKAFFIRLSDGSKLNLLEFYNSLFCIFDKNTGLGVTAEKWYDIEFRYVVTDGKTEVKSYVDDIYISSTSFDLDISTVKMDLRFHIIPTKSDNSTIMIDDIYSWSPRELICSLDTDTVAVDDSVVVQFSNKLKFQPNFLLNGSADNIGDIEYNSDSNSYTVHFKEYLLKNTAYTLTVDNAEDNYEQILSGLDMEFKTHDTALIITDYSYDGANVEFDIKNTGSETEHAFIAVGSYKDSKVKEIFFIDTDIAANSSEDIEFEFKNSTDCLKKIIVLRSRDNPYPLIKKVIDKEENAFGDFEYSSDISLVIDENNGRVDIYGQTDAENREIAVIVNNPDGSINYLDSQKSSSNGIWSFTFVCDDVSGDFTYALAGFSDGSAKSGGFRLVSLVDRNNFMRDINSVSSDGDVESCLERYKEVLEFNFSLFDELSDKAAVYKKIADYVTSGKSFSEIADVIEFLKSSAVCQAINEATNSGELAGIVEAHDDIIKFKSSKTYTLYSQIDIDEQNNLFNASLGIIFDDCDSFNSFMSQKTVLKALYKSQQYSEIQDIIENYYDVLGISLDEYNKLKTPSDIAKSLLNNSEFESAQSLNAVFTELVSKQYETETKPKEENKKPSQITIGGSASGGGGGSKPVVPGGTTIPTINNENETNKTNIEFSDIASDFWANSAIYSLCNKGTISGYPDGTFRPDNKVTRAEFVKMLVGYLGIYDSSAVSGFADISETAWYYSYISSAKKFGIVAGNDNNEFLPNSEISRQDMAVMLYRSRKYWKENKVANRSYTLFSDDNHISDYAKDAVETLYALNIINGDGTGAFLPLNNATRAEAATMIYGIEIR